MRSTEEGEPVVAEVRVKRAPLGRSANLVADMPADSTPDDEWVLMVRGEVVWIVVDEKMPEERAQALADLFDLWFNG